MMEDPVPHFSNPKAISSYADSARRMVPGLSDLHRMTLLLLAEGAQVELADNGHKGMTAVFEADPPFDAVLMDLRGFSSRIAGCSHHLVWSRTAPGAARGAVLASLLQPFPSPSSQSPFSQP